MIKDMELCVDKKDLDTTPGDKMFLRLTLQILDADERCV